MRLMKLVQPEIRFDYKYISFKPIIENIDRFKSISITDSKIFFISKEYFKRVSSTSRSYFNFRKVLLCWTNLFSILIYPCDRIKGYIHVYRKIIERIYERLHLNRLILTFYNLVE